MDKEHIFHVFNHCHWRYGHWLCYQAWPQYILAHPRVPANSFSASHSDGCLGNRSIASLWSFQEPSCLTALGFMAPLLLMIHTLSYSANTATWTDRFMGPHMQTPGRLKHRYMDKQGTFLYTQGNKHTWYSMYYSIYWPLAHQNRH